MNQSTTQSSNSDEVLSTQNISGVEFNALNDFRIYNKHKSMIRDTYEHKIQASGWAMAVYFPVPYDTTIFNVDFYTQDRSSDSSGNGRHSFATKLCDDTVFPMDLLENSTNMESIKSRMVCLDTESVDLTLMGNELATESKTLVLEINT